MRYVFLLTLVASALLLASCSGAEEELPQDAAQPAATAAPTTVPATPSPAVKGQLWRWLNVTLVLPEGSPVTIGRGTVPNGLKSEGGPGMGPFIDHGDPEAASYVIIDAVSGEILQDHVSAEDRRAIDEVLKTLAVSPFDEAEKGWPYQEDLAPDVERRDWGDVSYLIPDPASGLQITHGIGDPGGPFIDVSNGRSSIQITYEAQTGTVSQWPGLVSPLDKAAFDRYFSSIQ